MDLLYTLGCNYLSQEFDGIIIYVLGTNLNLPLHVKWKYKRRELVHGADIKKITQSIASSHTVCRQGFYMLDVTVKVPLN